MLARRHNQIDDLLLFHLRVAREATVLGFSLEGWDRHVLIVLETGTVPSRFCLTAPATEGSVSLLVLCHVDLSLVFLS